MIAMATYYALYVRCPACLRERRDPGPPDYWYHADGCGGSIEVGDDAHYRCTRCRYASHIRNWRYACRNHWGMYLPTSSSHFASAVSISGQLVNLGGRAWLTSLLANLGDW